MVFQSMNFPVYELARRLRLLDDAEGDDNGRPEQGCDRPVKEFGGDARQHHHEKRYGEDLLHRGQYII